MKGVQPIRTGCARLLGLPNRCNLENIVTEPSVSGAIQRRLGVSYARVNRWENGLSSNGPR